MKKNTRPFTLIEILTVIVIIAVIVGVTVPAYNRLMTGNAVSYGNRIVTSQLNMARTHACSKRRDVAVLFTSYSTSENPITYSSEAEEDPVALRAFRCAYVKEDGTDWKFDGWIKGSKWEYLPKGAFFPVNDNDATAKVKDTSRGFVSSAVVKEVKDDADSGDKMFSGTPNFALSVIFKGKNGRPVIGTSAPKVQVREGVINGNANDSDIVIKDNDENWAVSTVNRYTGAVTTEFNGED